MIFAFPEYHQVTNTISLSLDSGFLIKNKLKMIPANCIYRSYQEKKPATFHGIYNEAGFLVISSIDHLMSDPTTSDPIRKWASKLVSEDTTYHGYKMPLSVDTIANNFIAERLMRWEFAWQIFSKEFGFRKRLLEEALTI